MVTEFKTKQELIKALGSRDLQFVSDIEVVNDDGLRAVAEKAKAMLRQRKKLHVVLIQRD